MPDEDQSGVSRSKTLLDRRTAEKIGPMARLISTGMHEQPATLGLICHQVGQARDEAAFFIIQLRPRPDNRLACFGMHVGAQTTKSSLIMIAAQDNRTARRMLADEIQASMRIGAVTKMITKEGIALRPLPLGMGEAGRQCLIVGMNVGQDGKLHVTALQTNTSAMKKINSSRLVQISKRTIRRCRGGMPSMKRSFHNPQPGNQAQRRRAHR